MSTRTKNKVWYVGGLTFGAIILVYGVAQKWLSPTEGIFNLNVFAYVCAGGFLMFMAWFSHTFLNE